MFLNTSRLVAAAAMVMTLSACENEKAKTIDVGHPKIHATAMTTAAAFMVLKNTSATEGDRLVKAEAEGVDHVEMHTYKEQNSALAHAADHEHAAHTTEHAGHEHATDHAAAPAEAGHENAAAEHEHATAPAAEHPAAHGHKGHVMAMTPVSEIDVPAASEVELKPGGLHLMLIGLPEGGIKAGSSVKMKLTFEKAGEVSVDVPVVAH